jgi:Rrf2 family iron-sulfur cluster assembly transcriptional regulator
VDATLQEARCEKSRKGCDGEGECITFDLWNRLNEEMRRFLSSVTLASLAEKKRLEDSGVHVVRIDQLKKHK